jgi:hypothetical protein
MMEDKYRIKSLIPSIKSLIPNHFINFRSEKKRELCNMDIFLLERCEEYKDKIIRIGCVEDKCVNHFAYSTGIFISPFILYEIRFPENKEKIDKIRPGKGRTSCRIIIPSTFRSWTHWCGSKYCSLTNTDKGEKKTFDFYQFAKDLDYININWWTPEQRSEIIYLKYSEGGERIEYSIAQLKKKAREFYGEFDEDEYDDCLYKAMNLLPMDSPSSVNLSRSKLTHRRMRKTIIKSLGEDYRSFSLYELDSLKRFLKSESNRSCYDSTISCSNENIIVDHINWGALDKQETLVFKAAPIRSNNKSKTSFTKTEKRKIFDRFGNVFNPNNNCF